jgi:hypothetical protein
MLNVLVTAICLSRDREIIQHSNLYSMVSPRPLEATTGRVTQLKSNQTVTHNTLDATLPTQDGGKSSD